MNRIKFLILILLFVVFIPKVNAIVEPTRDFYVNDYANILSSELEDYIIDKSARLANADGTQIVVVTVKNLEGLSLEDYSIQLARKFGIGDASKNNGLLLLLALEEREFRVEVGYGLEGILPDGKTGRFQDKYIIPYLRENDWDNGVKNGYDAFYTEIVTTNNLDIDYNIPISVNNNSSSEETPPFVVFMLFFGYIGSFISGIIIRNIREKKDFYTYAYFIFWIIVAIFLFVKFIYDSEICMAWCGSLMFFVAARFGNFSSGGYSGGSRLSGSSRSSRGFSGGGGSFGGGGSSRRF